jgi:hypothetical protein
VSATLSVPFLRVVEVTSCCASSLVSRRVNPPFHHLHSSRGVKLMRLRQGSRVAQPTPRLARCTTYAKARIHNLSHCSTISTLSPRIHNLSHCSTISTLSPRKHNLSHCSTISTLSPSNMNTITTHHPTSTLPPLPARVHHAGLTMPMSVPQLSSRPRCAAQTPLQAHARRTPFRRA